MEEVVDDDDDDELDATDDVEVNLLLVVCSPMFDANEAADETIGVISPFADWSLADCCVWLNKLSIPAINKNVIYIFRFLNNEYNY